MLVGIEHPLGIQTLHNVSLRRSRRRGVETRFRAETEATLRHPITLGTDRVAYGAIISSPCCKLVELLNKNWGGGPVNLFTTDFGSAVNESG